MRHTAQPLTAGDWHGFPVLFERALQRKARCMASFEEEGSVVAVIGDLYGSLAAAHHGIRDDGLVGVHGDVLHRDLLLAFTAVTVERLAKPRERTGSLVGECQVSCTHFETLFRDPGPPVEVQRCGVFGRSACLPPGPGDRYRSAQSKRRANPRRSPPSSNHGPPGASPPAAPSGAGSTRHACPRRERGALLALRWRLWGAWPRLARHQPCPLVTSWPIFRPPSSSTQLRHGQAASTGPAFCSSAAIDGCS